MSKREEEVLRYVQQNADRLIPADSLRAQEVMRYVQENAERFTQIAPSREQGLIEKWGGALIQGLRDQVVPGVQSPEERGRQAVFGAGAIEAGILAPIEGVTGAMADVADFINRLPGLRSLPQLTFGGEGEETVSVFRRMSEFARRAREGILTEAEVGAIQSGVKPEEIAAVHGLGAFVGFSFPMTASYKTAGLLFNAPKIASARYPLAVLTAHLPQDFVAGAIYGGIFEPANGGMQRVKHALNESAVFGIGRLVLNGLTFPWAGARLRRFHLMKESGRIDELMTKIRNGEPIAITQEEASIVPMMLSEEEFVVNSIGAQIFIERGNAEAAILQGIIDSGGAGSSSGVVRGVGLSFEEVGAAVGKMKTSFPRLKFDVLKNQKSGNYDIVFGTQGLSNLQKKQMKEFGRFQGLMVEKSGAQYEFISNADFRKNDPRPWINVRTMDGKVTQIVDEGVTDLFRYREKVEPNQVLNRLFTDFRDTMEKELDQFTKQGLTSEADLIRGIRSGSVVLDDNARRAFTASGVLAYPEELGLPLLGEGGIVNVTYHKATGTTLRTGRLVRLGDSPAQGSWGFVEYGENLSDPPKRMIEVGATLQEAASRMEKSGWQAAGFRTATERGEQVALDITQQGMRAGSALPHQLPYVSLDDAVDAWATQRGLPLDAPDYPALRAYFASEYRNHLWKSIPEQDRAVFESIRDEFVRLSNSREIPLSAQAWNKGIHYEPQPDGKILLRDMRTGAFLTAQNEASAKEILQNIQRSDKDFTGAFMPFEGHGLSGMTGGWEHPGQGLYFGSSVPAANFMDFGDAPLLMNLRNVRDLFVYIESQTKFPLFTQVFDELDLAITRMRGKLEPYALRIEKMWENIPKRGKGGRLELTDWWQEIEGTDMSFRQAVRFLKDKGATNAQIKAWKEARDMFDLFYQLSGLPKSKYVHHYYSRVQPWVQQNKAAPDLQLIFGKGAVPPEFNWWAEMNRTGDLSMIERDPATVMQRYARGLFFRQEVQPIYNRARKLVVQKSTPRIQDFPKEIQQEILRSHPSAKPEDPILPPQIRAVMKEYLNILRGTPRESVQGLRDFTVRFFNALKIDADPRVIENAIDIWLSNMYGAAMALRPTLTARNATQTIWTHYTRLGGRYGGVSLERAMTQAGYDEAIAAGAIRSTTAGVPLGDQIWEHFLEEASLKGHGVVAQSFAGSLKAAMRLGQASSRVGRKFLVPYSSTDDMNRAWSYWWQKLHTEEVLNRFEAGEMSWKQFSKEGLPYFDAVAKDKFQKIYNTQGKEQALRWIGKVGSDEAQWIYGIGAQPAWMQNPVGKFVGMFGTWPIWASELYFNRAWKEGGAGAAKLYLRTLALVGAFSNMILESGYDLWSWIAPLSLAGWAGGPIVDHTINARRVIEAPLDQKGKALWQLTKNVGRLTFPGQVFINDVRRSLDSENVGEAGLKLMLGRPVDEYNFSLEVLYDSQNLNNIEMYLPEATPSSPPPLVLPGLELGGRR